MNKKKREEMKGLPGWMASYADMFTVLMAFFVLLFAFSTIDESKIDAFVENFAATLDNNRFLPVPGGRGTLADQGLALLPYVDIPPPAGAEGVEGAVGPDVPTDWHGIEGSGDTVGDMMNTFMTYLAQELPGPIDDLVGGGLGEYPYQIEPGDGFVRIIIDDEFGGVFFNPGQARLTSAAMSALDYLGPALANFALDGHGIIVEGHTDSMPINNAQFPSNWTLSGARASSVVEHLIVNFGIDVQMIAGLGRGQHFPVGDNSTVEGRAQNRRVEIKVFTQDITSGGAIAGWFDIPGT
jgi:chemotaxis protein MotB